MARTLPITGTLMALTTATVKAKVAGELIEVTVREGQTVRQGQLLARIDQTEVQARVAARSADAAAARAQLQLAEKNQVTQKALLDRNFISQNAFDTTQSGYDVAIARLRAAEADLVSARKTLGDSTLYAPFSGIVSERHAQPGERVPLDAKVLSIVDLSVLTLEASVPASSIAQVRVGQPVEFRVDGLGSAASRAASIESTRPPPRVRGRSASTRSSTTRTACCAEGCSRKATSPSSESKMSSSCRHRRSGKKSARRLSTQSKMAWSARSRSGSARRIRAERCRSSRDWRREIA